jgi:hypothetical protein
VAFWDASDLYMSNTREKTANMRRQITCHDLRSWQERADDQVIKTDRANRSQPTECDKTHGR